MFTVEQILSLKRANVISTSFQTSIRETARLMEAAEVGCVIIEDDKGLAGVFSERDMVARVIAMDMDVDSTAVGEVMSWPVKGCSLGDDMKVCADLLDRLHVRHLPVIDEGKVIGLISARDVLAVAFDEA